MCNRSVELKNLIDFGRRLYDPSLGHFLTPDPEDYSDGANLYAYVGNRPLTSQDPFGLMMNGNPYLYSYVGNHPLTAQDPFGLIMTQFNPNWLKMGSEEPVNYREFFPETFKSIGRATGDFAAFHLDSSPLSHFSVGPNYFAQKNETFWDRFSSPNLTTSRDALFVLGNRKSYS